MPSCQSLSSLYIHPPSPRLQARVPATRSSRSQTAQEAIATTAASLVSPSARCSDRPANGTSCLCSAFLLSSLPPWEAQRGQGIAAWRETCPLASLLSHRRCEEVGSAQNVRQTAMQLLIDDLVETLPGGHEAAEAGMRAAAAAESAQWTQPRRKQESQQCLAAEQDFDKLKQAGCISKREREQQNGDDERQAV
ncbi:hypothetical protein MY1884_003942 [Beauveria asiatica]